MLKARVKVEAVCAQEKMPSMNSVNEDELHQEREQTQPILTALQGYREGYLGSGAPQAPRHAPFQLPPPARLCSSPHCLVLAGVLAFPTLVQKQPALCSRNYPPNLIPSIKYDQCGLAALPPDELEK